MPISRKTFDDGKFKTRHNDIEAHPIAVLLRKNSNLAFSVKEIIKRTGIKEDTVRSAIRNLKIEKMVVHKQPYFAWKVVVKKEQTKRKSVPKSRPKPIKKRR